jgi:uncharacterized protein DUF6283
VTLDLLPCPTCPWRVDQKASSIPRYNHQKACGLRNTVGAEDAFRPIMACHYSTENEPVACKGYLAMEGERNLAVRVQAAKGEMPWPRLVFDACRKAGVQLHRNYRMVLRKLARTRSTAQ